MMTEAEVKAAAICLCQCQGIDPNELVKERTIYQSGSTRLVMSVARWKLMADELVAAEIAGKFAHGIV